MNYGARITRANIVADEKGNYSTMRLYVFILSLEDEILIEERNTMSELKAKYQFKMTPYGIDSKTIAGRRCLVSKKEAGCRFVSFLD